MGNTPAALEYIGTPRITAIGTANGFPLLMYCSKKPVGMNPCMAAPIPIPMSTYSTTLFTMPKASRVISGRRCEKVRRPSLKASSSCAWCITPCVQSLSSGSSFKRPRT